MKEKLKQKIKSYSFWTSMAGAVVVLLQSLSEVFGFVVSEKMVSNIIMAICGVLVVLGVVSMPTPPKKAEDKPAKKNNKVNDQEMLETLAEINSYEQDKTTETEEKYVSKKSLK
ncbi:MAG: phage holin [Clostridia bacterium]